MTYGFWVYFAITCLRALHHCGINCGISGASSDPWVDVICLHRNSRGGEVTFCTYQVWELRLIWQRITGFVRPPCIKHTLLSVCLLLGSRHRASLCDYLFQLSITTTGVSINVQHRGGLALLLRMHAFSRGSHHHHRPPETRRIKITSPPPDITTDPREADGWRHSQDTQRQRCG